MINAHKTKSEQFEADYNKALELADELKSVLNVIICDIQYMKPEESFSRVKRLQRKLLLELENGRSINLRNEIDETIFNLEQIENIRKFV